MSVPALDSEERVSNTGVIILHRAPVLYLCVFRVSAVLQRMRHGDPEDAENMRLGKFRLAMRARDLVT
jgi:hypothetical protein